MSEKMTCPGCQSHTSSILYAVQDGNPCPQCGLSATAILEVSAVQSARGDEKLKRRLGEALLAVDRAERRARDAETALMQVRDALEGFDLKD